MTTQLQTLNEGQALIYSRSNIRRAFPEFDDTDIAGIHLSNNNVVVVRTDGSEQTYAASNVRSAFQEFTKRLPHFFAYLGPNYRGPSIWRNNCYILFKGWHYQSRESAALVNAQAQRRWIDKFSLLDSEEKVKAALNMFDLGYIISPDGKTKSQIETSLTDDPEEKPEPFCSCGSFQRQLNILPQLQAEIPGYQPTCKHMTWFARYRNLLVKRSELIGTCRGSVAEQAVAWYYAPPTIGAEHGKFLILYTKHGQNAPLKYWRPYKPQEEFTEQHAWSLFDSMIERGFVPFPHTALTQITHAFKQK